MHTKWKQDAWMHVDKHSSHESPLDIKTEQHCDIMRDMHGKHPLTFCHRLLSVREGLGMLHHGDIYPMKPLVL